MSEEVRRKGKVSVEVVNVRKQVFQGKRCGELRPGGSKNEERSLILVHEEDGTQGGFCAGVIQIQTNIVLASAQRYGNGTRLEYH